MPKRKGGQSADTRRKKLKAARKTNENATTQNTLQQRLRRKNPAVQAIEKAINTVQRRTRRKNPLVRAAEQPIDAAQHRTRRKNPLVRAAEQPIDAAQHRTRRENLEVRNQEVAVRRDARCKFEVLSRKYERQIKDGPMHQCVSCDRLFFKSSIKKCTREILHNKGLDDDFINQIVLDDVLQVEELQQELQFCSTCYQNITKFKRPPRFCIKTSNLAFQKIPDIVKGLTSMEERLLAPRIPFMKIHALGCDRQLGIKGGVVNVPIDVRKMIKSIPLKPEETETIQLKLKRKMGFTHAYQYETIRIENVIEAAQLLVKTPLYISEDITFDDTWASKNIREFNANPDDIDTIMEVDNENNTSTNIEANQTQENAALDGDLEQVDLQQETLLESRDVIEFAPGEGRIPLSMLLDENCEELSFPSIYFGHARQVNPDSKLSYSDIVNSEIRRSDRRAVSAAHLLFANKKDQLQKINSGVNISMKKSAQTSGITASQALDKQFMDNIVSNDNAYRFLSGITGSPPYWEKEKKNLMAMIRQFGIFTMFITLSAAETHWPELLKILKKTVDNEDEADVSNLDFEEKCRLIRTDPVTCALYFDYRFSELKKTWKSSDGPFGDYEIENSYYRIEFQHRGSPHVHMVVWLKNAPIFDPAIPSTFIDVEEFIDKFISTSSENLDLRDLLKYQYHKCTRTCKRIVRGKQTCRFGAPFMPMSRTRILLPFPEDHSLSDETKVKYNSLHKKINEILSNNPSAIGSFEEMLEQLECNEEEYIETIRSRLTTNKVFVKREPKDCRINPYSPKILGLMRSNMDIQYVLDAYACVGYIVDYINKADRGLSRLLRDCVEDFKNGNFSYRERLKAVANTFYNSTEISSQEAAFCRLRLHLSSCSVATEFINTGPRETRQKILKSAAELKKLFQRDPNSQNIMKSGAIERYAVRPDTLEQLCLADFVSMFTFKSNNKERVQDEGDDNYEQEVIAVEVANEPALRLKNNSGTLHKRKQRKVIRFVNYDVQKDPNNFFRENVMLFVPWRNEIVDIEEKNCEDLFKQNQDLINEQRKLYFKINFNINELVEQLENDRLHQSTQSSSDDVSDPLMAYNYDPTVHQPNIMLNIGQDPPTNDVVKTYSVPDQLCNSDYLHLCDSLNEKQRDYLMHLLYVFKTKELPVYHFVSGGAGVGKSLLIKAVYQSVLRLYRSNPGPVESNEVILVAYTGKAAHNIGGMTAHQAFSLVITQNQSISRDLTAETLNTLRTKLRSLKLLIIDEISMMGTKILSMISRRLCQVFSTPQPFGGKSVLVFGDFNQLRPVGDIYAFLPLKDDLAQLVGNYLWELFQIFELTQIMRQRDDLLFAESLGRLANGSLTQSDMEMFNTRSFKNHQSLPDVAKSAIHLFKSNEEVDHYNQQRLTELKTISNEHVINLSKDKVIGQFSERDKLQTLSSLEKMSTQKTYGLAKSVELQVGVRYMISTNIDVADGLFNGASGFMRHIEMNQNTTPPTAEVLWLEFDDETVGLKARADRQNIQDRLHLPPNFVPINKIQRVFKPTKKGQAQICREQFPLVVAEGITIHKSQGQSMKRVVVAISDSMERSLLYVALSRATSLNGLFLIGHIKPVLPPAQNHPVLLEMNRLRQNSQLIPKFNFLRAKSANTIQILSQNIQSLPKHLNSIASDPVYTQSHLLLLQETWASDNQFGISGFCEINRNLFNGRPSARGTMIFAQNTQQVIDNGSLDVKTSQQHIEITSCIYEDVTFINVYKHPKCTMKYFKDTINLHSHLFEGKNYLLCGDFNEDFSKNAEIETFLTTEYGMKMFSPKIATTNGGTTLDAVFGKTPDYMTHVYVYETYFSYHKPLIIWLNKI